MKSSESLIREIDNLIVIENSLAIWSLGQMGFVIKGPDAIFYIDPCLSNLLEDELGSWWYRAYDPPIVPEDISHVDYYFITHEHYDHLDKNTLIPISKISPQARFISSGWCKQDLNDCGVKNERIIVPNVLKSMDLPGCKAKVTPVPSAHYELDFDKEKGYRWLGFIIEWNGVTIYHAGDTVIYKGYIDTLKELAEKGIQIDIAILPINGRDYFRENNKESGGAFGNLLPIEAAQLALEMNWDIIIPGHNDLYPNNTIPYSNIVEAIDKIAPSQKYKIMRAGELFYYVGTT